ncbi:MAG: hypothetical protein ACOY6N_11535 [Pseudomonadota bacterium]
MDKPAHPVITKDYPENIVGGFMICGINFGYSQEDEALEKSGKPVELNPLSFFSDKAVNNTLFRNTVLTWLSSWGFEFATEAGHDGEFERAFFQTNWLDTQTRSIDSDELINLNKLVQESDSFLTLLEARKPSIIFFFSNMMIEALNDIRIRERVVSILGKRSGNARIYQAELPNYTGIKHKMLAQEFGETQIISLPHPQARGISLEYIAALKPPKDVIQKMIDKYEREHGKNRV